jgi:hypothetical protein
MGVPLISFFAMFFSWLVTTQGSGFRVQGSGFRVQGSGFRVQGSGFRKFLQPYNMEIQAHSTEFMRHGAGRNQRRRVRSEAGAGARFLAQFLLLCWRGWPHNSTVRRGEPAGAVRAWRWLVDTPTASRGGTPTT